MCKAYDESAKTFDNIIYYDLLINSEHLAYSEIIDKIRATNENFSARYSPHNTIKDILKYYLAIQKLALDSQNRYYYNTATA